MSPWMEIAGGIGMAIGGGLVGYGLGYGDGTRWWRETARGWENLYRIKADRLYAINRQRRRAAELGRLSQAKKRSEERQRANDAMRDALSRVDA
jgi:hypothetical protein